MRIILCGPGASGKDHLKDMFEAKGFKRSISYTTRAPRKGEVDGVDYNFTTEEKFAEMVESGVFYEWQPYPARQGGKDIIVHYGTTNEHFYSATLFIMTPSGLRDLKPADRLTSMVMYLEIPEDIRMERLSKRVNADDPAVRIKNDRKDFENFTDFDVRITNPHF
jgi:guanylate kinase